ncbi:uncharacterized protein LOC108099771 [Drosophila ficusphila]|uniref:uncharacterized protein LOC108099771 n=1 Tax=Drosophila ficusphila TaxID=30025 RepID=UPI0007E88D31|nr:uncharacterized protein LOC108099771 [Drosophila ficusphila]
MSKGVRMANEGLSRMHNAWKQSREIVNSHQKFQKKLSKPSGQPLHPSQIHNQNINSPISKFQESAISEDEFGALMQQQDFQVEKHHTDRQTLADIILMQARRIEKQQRELHRIKAHYERQVSTIKNNAIMLETHLQKLLSGADHDRARQIGHHYNDMFGAVQKLQKGCIQTKPPSVSNELLIKFLNSQGDRRTNETISTYRNML